MHYPTLLLTLLATPAFTAALHLPANKRSHAVDLNAPRAHKEARSIPSTPKKKAKRVVKKKRSQCQVPVNATLTRIGDNNVATGTVSSPVSASASASASPSPASASASASPSPSATQPVSSSPWSHVTTWSGASFFDNWEFFHWDDPTHGTVDYVDVGTAWDEGLISINSANGHAMMKYDTTQQVSGARKAVRIQGNLVFTGGMVLMDAYHMPYGCGTWPAWWQNGPNWPYGGEIDILEGVNAFTQNQVSLHTGSGCKMPNNQNDGQYGAMTTGWFDSYNCASYETANEGCGVRDGSGAASYGKAFNDVGGGVYALVWQKTGISAYFFPRSNIPADINAEQPDPSKWGEPMANFPADNCNPYQYFYDHFSIFTNTLCGDWAGADAVWNYAGYAGQSQSCAAITGYSSCSDYVLNQGSAFNDAFWEIGYVKYFNSTTLV